jgi:hypothetical protein
MSVIDEQKRKNQFSCVRDYLKCIAYIFLISVFLFNISPGACLLKYTTFDPLLMTVNFVMLILWCSFKGIKNRFCFIFRSEKQWYLLDLPKTRGKPSADCQAVWICPPDHPPVTPSCLHQSVSSLLLTPCRSTPVWSPPETKNPLFLW